MAENPILETLSQLMARLQAIEVRLAELERDVDDMEKAIAPPG